MNILSLCLVHDGSCAEKGTDFHHRMKYQMRKSRCHAKGRHNRHAKQDIREIADRGIGQPSF